MLFRSNPDKPLYCGNSGTTIRLLAGLLAGKRITAEFTGDDSLAKRPMDRVIAPLNEMGVIIESNNGHIPFTIKPRELNGISFVPSVASAQVKSCIILAGLGAIGQTLIDENVKTRDHSEIILKELGAPVSSNGTISINQIGRASCRERV